jgi:hypothetical protein
MDGEVKKVLTGMHIKKVLHYGMEIEAKGVNNAFFPK